MPFCRLFNNFLLICVACALYSKVELTGKEKPMYRTEKETSKGLKILLVISFIFLAIFILGFIVFGANASKTGDADLKDFGKVFSYHFGNFGDLFTFKLNEASNIFYVALSGLLYGLITIVVIFLIVGIFIAAKKKRAIMAFGIVLAVISLFIYMLGASGLPKYWAILNKRGVFETNQQLLGPTVILIVAGSLFAILSYITYFACVIETFKNPGVEDKDAPRKGEQPVMFEAIKNEKPKEEKPVIQESAAFEEESAQEEEVKEEESFSKKDLAELIRSIVRDEMNRNAPNTNQYSNSPLIVQYFGTVPTQQVEQPVKKEEPAPAPAKEPAPEPQPEPVEEPQPEPAPQEEVIVEPEPVVETPVEEAPAEKKPIIRIPFQVRMMNADEEMKRNYNELKNEILSYGVNSRVSNSGDAFRLHRKTYVKLTIAGLSLKLYFALNPEDYKDSPIPVQDAGHKGIYAEIPLVFKVKSGLSMRRCKELIQTVMEKDGLEQGPIGDTDWVEKLKEQPVDENPEED